jgi:hypothetical protein
MVQINVYPTIFLASCIYQALLGRSWHVSRRRLVLRCSGIFIVVLIPPAIGDPCYFSCIVLLMALLLL